MSEWISVEDSNPSDGEYVIVWVEPFGKKVNYSFFTTALVRTLPDNKDAIVFYSKGSNNMIEDVTHWMKPKPPTTNTEE